MEFLFTKKATSVRAFTFPLYHNEIRFAQLGEFNPLEFDREKWIFHRFFKLSSQKSVKHSRVLRLQRYYLEFLFWSFHSTIAYAEYFEYLWVSCIPSRIMRILYIFTSSSLSWMYKHLQFFRDTQNLYHRKDHRSIYFLRHFNLRVILNQSRARNWS